jgi:hypothetical protein
VDAGGGVFYGVRAARDGCATDEAGFAYRFADPDFRIGELRSNAVLRWEYRPGSTLFLVWQQRRAFRDLEAANFDVGGEAADLFRDRPTNIFVIKANYWLSL